ncbi:uncharacterized protein IUM83_05053 [Phytophthora cinnamomi]|uniref:uncharacterized protein n=1 Tax=Phytophthora cinnamomi TaxID=4785 RepID=UPI003559FE2E|nr:hypothetical protein IUM83_05053 [Phytophthora cinnamomi]
MVTPNSRREVEMNDERMGDECEPQLDAGKVTSDGYKQLIDGHMTMGDEHESKPDACESAIGECDGENDKPSCELTEPSDSSTDGVSIGGEDDATSDDVETKLGEVVKTTDEC